VSVSSVTQYVNFMRRNTSSYETCPALPNFSTLSHKHHDFRGENIYRTYKKVKFSRYRPGVAQKVGRGIALLFHDRGTRRGWVVSSTPRPHFTSGKDPVPILQEAGWAPGPVWTDGKSRPHRDSIPDRPARSSVALPTELPRPTNKKYVFRFSLQFLSQPFHSPGRISPYPAKVENMVSSW